MINFTGLTVQICADHSSCSEDEMRPGMADLCMGDCCSVDVVRPCEQSPSAVSETAQRNPFLRWQMSEEEIVLMICTAFFVVFACFIFFQ